MGDGKEKSSDVTMIDTTTSASAGHQSPSKTGTKH
jgi:hypothetical protein